MNCDGSRGPHTPLFTYPTICVRIWVPQGPPFVPAPEDAPNLLNLLMSKVSHDKLVSLVSTIYCVRGLEIVAKVFYLVVSN